MIAASEPKEFVPFGSECLQFHPNQRGKDSAHSFTNSPSVSKTLLRALRGVSLHNNADREFWKLRELEHGEGEEELYICKNTVIWSRSNGNNLHQVVKMFSLEGEVQDALWCTYDTSDFKARHMVQTVSCEKEEPLPFLSIIESVSSNIHSFSRNGQEFISTVPFVISKAWNIKHGLLLERSMLGGSASTKVLERPASIFFSLLNPLNEVTPVLTKVSGKVQYQCSSENEIVFTSVNPSLLMMYQSSTGIHTLWEVRRTTTQEVQESTVDHGTLLQGSTSLVGTPSESSRRPSHLTLASSTPLTHLSVSHLGSPASYRLSPVQNPMATLSRCQSPLNVTSKNERYNSPMSHHFRSMHLISPLSKRTSTFLYNVEPPETVMPDVCLDHLWSEPKTDNYGEKAKKTFLSTDFTGQSFLCYLLPKQRILKLVKYSQDSNSEKFKFGAISCLSVIDAENISSLKMILTLDLGYTLTLYTGLVKICKVHVPSVVQNFNIKSELQLSPTFPCTPRRSSLAPSVKTFTDIIFDDDIKMLSPVPQENAPHAELSASEEPSVPVLQNISLCDAVHNRVTVETSYGFLYRISLPKISNCSVVVKCLEALRSVLPKEVACLVHSKWYMSHNAPGSTTLSAISEFRYFLKFLLIILGYNLDFLCSGSSLDLDLFPSSSALKKPKTSEEGTDEDWNYLLDSHGKAKFNLSDPSIEHNTFSDKSFFNASAVLFHHFHTTLFSLHLVYEDLKLDTLHWEFLPDFAQFLFRLSGDLGLYNYQDLYIRDFPDHFKEVSNNSLTANKDIPSLVPSYFSTTPPSIYRWIKTSLMKHNCEPFPIILNVTDMIRTAVLVYKTLTTKENTVISLNICSMNIGTSEMDCIWNLPIELPPSTVKERLVRLLTHIGVEVNDLCRWPCGVVVPILDAFVSSQEYPPPEWSSAEYDLIGREDLSVLSSQSVNHLESFKQPLQISDSAKQGITKEDEDGFDSLNQDILRLLYRDDQRVAEVCKMMSSSKPVSITIQQRSEVSDHEFIEEQERYLYTMCIRTMALPVGRGMFTLCTYQPVVTETLPIPKLCLTGRVPPGNTTVDMSHIDVPANMNLWPLFHNGVAAGLRITPHASEIDSAWVIYNRPRTSASDIPIEHGGFLMGLGLNGHLSNLESLSIHDYLLKTHELTTVGLVLGIAASKRRSMDLAATKIMSIHIEALLPPTSTELDVPSSVRAAAILGIGLVYEASAHQHMSEVLLGEIGKPPGPEMDHCVDRESYALASGLALGLVMLGKGSSTVGLTDLPMTDQLYHYMVGGYARPTNREKYKSPSYQIREGNSINVDVTSPGATLALGFMFFDSGNRAVAEWMTAPDTQYLLDMVRPDFLMLRTLSKGLILWSEVYPNKHWVESHLPAIVSKHAFKRGAGDVDIDYETMSQAYCNILAGACFCLGLKFAGSANEEAFSALMHYVKMFLSLLGKPAAEQAGKNTLETCLMVTVLSLAMVMAGTGDLEVLKICRYLRSRVSQALTYVFYGSHLATHMALGLLFLGGGRFTLSSSPSAVAAMICAYFPKFPTHSNDNRYHLQAFRHLYVLAAQPRLVIPVDINTKKPVYAHLRVQFKDTQNYKDAEYKIRAPCHLPELHLLKRVELLDSRYWPMVFEGGKNWDVLKYFLQLNGVMYVKQKVGCLPYNLDPKGHCTVYAKSMLKNSLCGWSSKSTFDKAFSENPIVLKFAECFLQPRATVDSEMQLQHVLCKILFDCAVQEKTAALPALSSLLLSSKNLLPMPMLHLWQLKLMLTYQQWAFSQKCYSEKLCVLSSDFVYSLKSAIEEKIISHISGKEDSVLAYLGGQERLSVDVAPFVIFYDLLVPKMLNLFGSERSPSLPLVCYLLQNNGMSVPSILALFSLLKIRNS